MYLREKYRFTLLLIKAYSLLTLEKYRLRLISVPSKCFLVGLKIWLHER